MTNQTLTRGARGGAITIGVQIARVALNLVGLVILSRLLSPADFGLVAIVGVFITFGELIKDFGIPTAALQSRALTHQQASNAFWLSALLGVVTALAIALSAPILVAVFDEPRLAVITPLLALSVAVNGFQSQLQVQLARDMRFSAIAYTGLASQIVGLVVGIAMAVAGLGYWALIGQALVAPLVLLVTRALTARWVPSRPRRRHGSRALFRSGAHLGLSAILSYLASNVDTMMIGARFGVTAVGYYNRAFQLLTLPLMSVFGTLDPVIIPTVNRSTEEGQRHDRLLLRIQTVLAVPVIFFFSLVSAAAPSLIPLVLGAQWVPSVTLFQILALGGCFWALSYVSYWAFLAGHHTRELLHYNLLTKPLTIGLVVVGAYYSPTHVAWAYAISLVVSWPINLIWLSRLGSIRLVAFLWGGTRPVISGAFAFTAGTIVLYAMGVSSGWSASVVSLLVAAAVFAVVLVCLPGGLKSIREGLSTVRLLFRREVVS